MKMESFQALPWRVTDVSTIDIETKFITDETIANSYIFNNSLAREKIEEDKKHDKKLSCLYPENSRLLKAFHLNGLKAIALLNTGQPINNFTTEEQSIILKYKVQENIMREENQKFLKFLEEKWYSNSHIRAEKFDSQMYKYAHSKWLQKLEFVKSYDKFYENIGMIHLASEHAVEVYHHGCLLELGNIANVLDNINCVRTVSYPSLTENLYEEHISVTKYPVSRDIHAEQLAIQSKVNIVISSSAIKTIAANFAPDFAYVWDIPVVVKEYDVEGRKIKIAYVDKVLPQRNISVKDLNISVRKILLKTSICRKVGHSFETPKHILDNFCKSSSNSNEESSLNEEQKSDIEKDSNQKETIETISKEKKKKSKNCIIHQNVSYRIWEMKLKNNENVLLKSCVDKKGISLLIRSKIDGFKTKEDGGILPINFAPKMEYQSEYGGEIHTKNELIKQWATLYFRPFSNLLRVRINTSNRFIHKEYVNLVNIANECLRNYKFTPNISISVLFNVLSNLTDLSPGNYLLHHTTKEGPFVSLMKSTNNTTNSLNLYDLYDVNNCEVNRSAKWIPIDSYCILAKHLKEGYLPGLFKPFEEVNRKRPSKSKKKRLFRKTRKKLEKQKKGKSEADESVKE